MTNYYDELFGKNFTVYRETEMIEIQKNYKLTLTEQQAKELYEFLRGAKDCGHLSTDRDLVLVYHELKKLFDAGIR